MKSALIVSDVQNDFCEGGSLPVTGGAQVAAGVAALLRHGSAYDHVVATKDHHVDPGDHWAHAPDFVDSWPVHCRVGTEGEALHPNLDPAPFDAVFLKGERAAAYSGFEGSHDGQGLADWLRAHEVTRVDVCGIATDHCVRATALDAAEAGFETTLLLDLCAGVAPETTAAALTAIARGGCPRCWRLTTCWSSSVRAVPCGSPSTGPRCSTRSAASSRSRWPSGSRTPRRTMP